MVPAGNPLESGTWCPASAVPGHKNHLLSNSSGLKQDRDVIIKTSTMLSVSLPWNQEKAKQIHNWSCESLMPIISTSLFESFRDWSGFMQIPPAASVSATSWSPHLCLVVTATTSLVWPTQTWRWTSKKQLNCYLTAATACDMHHSKDRYVWRSPEPLQVKRMTPRVTCHCKMLWTVWNQTNVCHTWRVISGDRFG